MSSDNQTNPKSGGNLNFLFIVGLIITILAIVFAVQNADKVSIKFFTLKFEVHQALLIISCIAIGAFLSILFGIPSRWRSRQNIKKLNNEIKTLKETLNEKNTPTDAGV